MEVFLVLGAVVLVVIIAVWLMRRNPEVSLLPREIQESRQPNGIFVVMKTELIQRVILTASRRRMSRSALCRELILRGLEVEANKGDRVRG